MAIPYVVHQTWKTSTVPDHWTSSKERWEQTPGIEYRLWTDEMNRELIATHYSWFLKQYDAYPYNIQRADAVRYFILHRYGGIYCDLDIAPTASMRPLIDFYNAQGAEIVIGKSAIASTFGKHALTNAFMMSAPGCAFWPTVWKFLEDPFRNPRSRFTKRVLSRATKHFSIIFGTGPGIINEAAQAYDRENPNSLFRIPSEFVQPSLEWEAKPFRTRDSAVEILDGGSWHSWDSKCFGALHKVCFYNTRALSALVVILSVLLTWQCIAHARYRRRIRRRSRQHQ